jgi:anti-sigma regulatory factor (Ser/Thr protein kinase)
VEIVLTNQPEDRQNLAAALEAFARQNQLPARVLQAADLSLEEHITNILRYAYDDAQPRRICVRLDVLGGCLQIEVADDGRPFDPLQKPRVDTSLPLEDKPVGGLGIHLIRQFMDEIQYCREANLNILRLRKRINAPASGA